MTSPGGLTGGLSLARVTVAAPTRRMDVALPDNMVVAELLPHLIRHADDALGEADERQGGWVLRRATGTVLEPQRNLAAQGVRDGELLHLSPRRDDWPELAYDDVVEVIAGGARRAGRSWGGPATRACGLAVVAAAAVVALAGLVATGPPWGVTAAVALGVAAVLAVAGILLSRAFSDATAGGVVAGVGLPYAFLGGSLLLTPPDAGLTHLGAPGLLLGSAALLVFGVLGHTGVAGVPRLFMAGISLALLGALAALLCLAGVSGAGAAAVALTVAIGLLPSYPIFASWLGRLPFPELPSRAEQILHDKPLPRRTDVFAAVARATEMLTGLLLAAAAGSIVAITYLTWNDRSTASIVLCVAGAAALLLRARLFPAPRQRLPLLIAGFLGLAVLGVGAAAAGRGAAPGLLLLVGALAVAGAALVAALVYGRRAPSPYLGRAADIADVLAIMALIPLACAVLGVFGAVRGLFASIGG